MEDMVFEKFTKSTGDSQYDRCVIKMPLSVLPNSASEDIVYNYITNGEIFFDIENRKITIVYDSLHGKDIRDI